MLNLEIVKSALVSTVLMAILSMAIYIVGLGDIFKVNWLVLVNTGVLAFLTGCISIIKSLLTNEDGKFAGIVQIK